MTAAHAARLAAVRKILADRGVDGFFLPRTDAHGSEYLPANAERVAWLTGFTGSAGQAVVLMDKAAVFSDGRYTVQLAAQVDEALFERRHSIEQPASKWIEEHLPEGGRLGYDPFLLRRAEKERLETVVGARGGTLVALDRNPIDEAWTDRPDAPVGQTHRLDDRWTGESSAQKRTRIAADLVAKGADELLLTSPDSIAWLLNVRGSDIPFNPLCLSYALLSADGTCCWFVDERKLAPDLSLENAISVEPQDRLLSSLDGLGKSGAKVLVDPAEVHVGFLDRLHAAGARLIEGDNPIVLAKACKNATEIEGAVQAQIRDGAALVRFLAWLDRQPLDGSLDEIGAARKLNEERARDPLFRGPSFGSISAHGPNAALPHYHATPDSNRPLTGDTLYLIDSGGQYLDATTDVTRTVALGTPSAEMCRRFTLVLKGMIAIATSVFPEGTTGAQLDSFARAALWREGLDFDHGTGHGVGAYLCVHEGPARIAKAGTATALKPGMILSDEPGYYKLGAYGIRIENLVAVEARGKPEGADKNLLGFRTLTLAPIDRRLIVPDLLTADERTWLDGYHAHVRDRLAPLLDPADQAWLEAATAAL